MIDQVRPINRDRQYAQWLAWPGSPRPSALDFASPIQGLLSAGHASNLDGNRRTARQNSLRTGDCRLIRIDSTGSENDHLGVLTLAGTEGRPRLKRLAPTPAFPAVLAALQKHETRLPFTE